MVNKSGFNGSVRDGLDTYFALAAELDKVNVTGVSNSAVQVRTAEDLKSEIEALVDKYTSEVSPSKRKTAPVEKPVPSAEPSSLFGAQGLDSFLEGDTSLRRRQLDLIEANSDMLSWNNGYAKKSTKKPGEIPRLSKMPSKPSRSKLERRLGRLQKSILALNSPTGTWGFVCRAFKGHNVSTYSGAVRTAVKDTQSAIAAIDKLQEKYEVFLFGEKGLHSYVEAYHSICVATARELQISGNKTVYTNPRIVGQNNFHNEKEFMETGTKLVSYDRVKTAIESSVEMHEKYLSGLTQLKASLQTVANNLGEVFSLQRSTGYNSLAFGDGTPHKA